jgi:hypothetical protein
LALEWGGLFDAVAEAFRRPMSRERLGARHDARHYDGVRLGSCFGEVAAIAAERSPRVLPSTETLALKAPMQKARVALGAQLNWDDTTDLVSAPREPPRAATCHIRWIHERPTSNTATPWPSRQAPPRLYLRLSARSEGAWDDRTLSPHETHRCRTRGCDWYQRARDVIATAP